MQTNQGLDPGAGNSKERIIRKYGSFFTFTIFFAFLKKTNA